MAVAGSEDRELKERISHLVSSSAPDREVLEEVVRLLHESHPRWHWTGIYLLKGDELVLGPCSAPASHERIAVGEGVCGTAVAEGENQLVGDVREVENYLACSLSTRSEIVVLIRHAGRIVGQFDVDSDEVGAFGEEDETLLEDAARIVAPRVAALAASAG
ncbi:GAF domain-containing protein [Rubrobacter calidifluminis]|uniref:GAF domain-containing protein n=1 Tax=Rubrobacter calidifluminis TaxID=1392640 RepID=UPI002361397C|nr:GAF domain-containing protein [Rubrobacter calidifluminis]